MNMPPAGAAGFRDEVVSDPGLFPQKIDFFRQMILFVRLQRSDFQQASFLDDRILTPQTDGKWARFDSVESALASAAPMRPLHFIFHAGHVGSTLLSRLLEEAGGVLALREPLPLRALAEAQDVLGEIDSLISPEQFDSLMRGQLLLWSRGYPDTRMVVVKATSTAARLAPRLLAAHPSARAIYLNLDFDSYLAALLAGDNSIVDLRGHGAERMRRLQAFAAPPATPLHAMSAGELAALAWVTETLTQTRLSEAFGPRVLSMDFNLMLRDVGGALRDACRHFDLSAPDAYFANAPQSRVLQRYAKAPEAPYSPRMRADILTQARALKAEEILKGRRWIEALSRRCPAVEALFSPP